jgi:hypothetical protein
MMIEGFMAINNCQEGNGDPQLQRFHPSPNIRGAKWKEIKQEDMVRLNISNLSGMTSSILIRDDIRIGRLSSASNYKTNENAAKSPQASTLMMGSRGSLPTGISIKRVTSAYNSNNRPRAGG